MRMKLMPVPYNQLTARQHVIGMALAGLGYVGNGGMAIGASQPPDTSPPLPPTSDDSASYSATPVYIPTSPPNLLPLPPTPLQPPEKGGSDTAPVRLPMPVMLPPTQNPDSGALVATIEERQRQLDAANAAIAAAQAQLDRINASATASAADVANAADRVAAAKGVAQTISAKDHSSLASDAKLRKIKKVALYAVAGAVLFKLLQR